MNPSRYKLPQKCSPDRQRARRATLALRRKDYELASDDGPGNPAEGFRLPPGLPELPRGERFGAEKLMRLLGHKLVVQAHAPIVKVSMLGCAMETAEEYERVVGWLPRPREADLWDSDESFGRQRLRGVNPMALHRCQELPEGALAVDADQLLRERHVTRLNAAFDSGRLYSTDYSGLQDPRIQAQVQRGATLAAPTCLFYVDDSQALVPIAIRLRPAGASDHPVLTPLDGRGDWLMARAHAQAADAHYHEAVYHLLETHMVSEVFAIATARELHPDHPLHQLLAPHFEWNLAINNLARRDLLSLGGPIDQALAAGTGGAMDLARLVWSGWSFEKHTLKEDMKTRGVEDAKTLPGYLYRDDALGIWEALHRYVVRILDIWYPSDALVGGDFELQAWRTELARHIPGFPKQIRTRMDLILVATEIIYRASAGHSAVNNGQFDSYAFVPNGPGCVFSHLPVARNGTRSNFQDLDVLRALPGTKQAMAAIDMSWILSQPTYQSLLTVGESPAFAKDLCPEAYAAVDALRSELRCLSAAIGIRNRGMAVPYTYLDPKNVARSTAV